MVDIVVFGKPRSFESFSFDFEGHSGKSLVNAHGEPVIKPTGWEQQILHYYVKNDKLCFEYYIRASSCSADRAGSMLGIGIITDKDISLYEALCVLGSFLNDFCVSFLDNRKFKKESIVNELQTTKWSDSEVKSVINLIKNTSFVKPSGESLAMVVSDLSDIKHVESDIKQYSEAYIVNDKKVFEVSEHSDYLNKCNKKIFTIDDKGCIVNVKPDAPVKPEGDTPPPPEPKKTIIIGPTPPLPPGPIPPPPPPIWEIILKRILPIMVILAALVVFIVYVIVPRFGKKEPEVSHDHENEQSQVILDSIKVPVNTCSEHIDLFYKITITGKDTFEAYYSDSTNKNLPLRYLNVYFKDSDTKENDLAIINWDDKRNGFDLNVKPDRKNTKAEQVDVIFEWEKIHYSVRYVIAKPKDGKKGDDKPSEDNIILSVDCKDPLKDNKILSGTKITLTAKSNGKLLSNGEWIVEVNGIRDQNFGVSENPYIYTVHGDRKQTLIIKYKCNNKEIKYPQEFIIK